MPQDRFVNWTLEEMTAFWDFESNFPDRYFTHHNADGLAKRLDKYFAESESILDYGCGSGLFLVWLAEQGYRVAGSDTSEQSLKAVRDRLRRYDNFLGVFTPDALLAQGRQFDTILAIEVVEHLHDDWLDHVLGTLRRLLKPNGRLIVTTPNQERLEDSLLMCPCCKSVFHRWQHVRTWSQGSLTEYVERRGFRVLEAFATDFSEVETPEERWKKLPWWKKMKKSFRGKIPSRNRLSPVQQPHLALVCEASE